VHTSNPTVSRLPEGRSITSWQDTQPDCSSGQITSAVREITRTVTGDDNRGTHVGDALRNVMYGNDRDDSFSGGGGNDEFHGDDAQEVVIELSGEGTDTVYASAHDTMGPAGCMIRVGNADQGRQHRNARVAWRGWNSDKSSAGNAERRAYAVAHA
jgi:Ca2+-binding RTX toxin-like protein